MRRLGGIDSAFLGMETSAVHAHVVAVSVYDPSSSPHVFDAEHSKRLLMSKLDKIPAFRRRLAVVPGRFSMPYWIDDPDFDIENHVFEERHPVVGQNWRLRSMRSLRFNSTARDRCGPITC